MDVGDFSEKRRQSRQQNFLVFFLLLIESFVTLGHGYLFSTLATRGAFFASSRAFIIYLPLQLVHVIVGIIGGLYSFKILAQNKKILSAWILLLASLCAVTLLTVKLSIKFAGVLNPKWAEQAQVDKHQEAEELNKIQREKEYKELIESAQKKKELMPVYRKLYDKISSELIGTHKIENVEFGKRITLDNKYTYLIAEELDRNIKNHYSPQQKQAIEEIMNNRYTGNVYNFSMVSFEDFFFYYFNYNDTVDSIENKVVHYQPGIPSIVPIIPAPFPIH